MRARVGWTSSAAIFGTGVGGIAAPIGLRSGPLGLLWLILLICGAALLLVTGSPAARRRPAGQHRNGQSRFGQPGADQPGFGRQWLSLSRQVRYQHPYQETNAGQLRHGRHRRIGSAA
jgi:hypothetical protein